MTTASVVFANVVDVKFTTFAMIEASTMKSIWLYFADHAIGVSLVVNQIILTTIIQRKSPLLKSLDLLAASEREPTDGYDKNRVRPKLDKNCEL